MDNNDIALESLSSRWLETNGRTKLVLSNENSTILDCDFGARLLTAAPPSTLTSPAAVNAVLSGDSGDRHANENTSDMVELDLRRKSAHSLNRAIVSSDYEAPPMYCNEEDWKEISYFRIQQRDNQFEWIENEHLRHDIVTYVNDNKQQPPAKLGSFENITYQPYDFKICEVKVMLQIKLSATGEILPIKQVQPFVDVDENGKWRSYIDVEYKRNSPLVRYDITSYKACFKGRLISGQGCFMEGNLKEVYRGVLTKEENNEKEVIVKIVRAELTPEGMRAFEVENENILRESWIMREIASQLYEGKHSNLALDVLGVYMTVPLTKHMGYVLTVYPYISRYTLRSILNPEILESCSLKILAFIAKDILMALQQLHDLNYAHLDVTYDNIMMTADYHFKLIDFGQTRKTNSPVNLKHITRKVRFLNPFHLQQDDQNEILLQGERLKKIDMWDVGIILFEAVFGKTCEESLETVKKSKDLVYPPFPASLEVAERNSLTWVKNSELIFELLFNGLSPDEQREKANELEVVKHLLDHNDRLRWDGNQVLEHVWLDNLREEERQDAFAGAKMSGKRPSGTTMMTRSTYPRYG